MKKLIRFLLIIILILSLLIIYARYGGTRGLITKEYQIETTIDDSFDGLKIVHFSDLHYLRITNKETTQSIIEEINLLNPDIVVFTGDLIDKNYDVKDEDITKLKTNLKKIKAEFGKYYVLGEQDSKKSIEVLNSSNFINLDEKIQYIYPKTNIPIAIISKETCNLFFEENKDEIPYNLLILHNPDDINNLKNNKIDVALSGHTLNGMINIPKIKNLLIKSEYKKDFQKVNNIDLYINPGIGERKIKARLFNHPTIYLYRINKAS